MKYFVFECERATLVGSQNRCVVGLPSETHLKFYQVDIEDFDNEVYSYEVEARNDEEAALKAEDTRQVRDVCIFRINGMEVFL